MIRPDKWNPHYGPGTFVSSSAFQHGLGLTAALVLIWQLAARRFLDFSDEGFYLASAWLAYSDQGQLPVSNLLMNFGVLLGIPYVFAEHPPIIAFRFISLLAWYAVHFAFISTCGRILRGRVSVWLVHLLAVCSLFVLLIPMLSYQNMPALFLLMSVTLFLRGELNPSAAHAGATPLLAPIPLGLALVSSTGVVIPFAAGASLMLCRMLYARRIDWKLIGGLALAGAVGLSAIRFKTILDAGEILAFFNSEVVYTSGSRLTSKLGEIGSELGFCVAVCVLISTTMVMFGRSLASLAVGSAALAWALYSLIVLIVAKPASCAATCDIFLMAYIKSSLVASSIVLTKVFWLDANGPSTRIGWALLSILFLQAYLSVVSNAPLQYNIKYASPAALSLLILLATDQIVWRTSYLKWIAPPLLGAILCLPAGWIIAKSTYGRGSIADSTKTLPGSDFRFMRGDDQRRTLLANLTEAYRAESCDRRYFASVDSLMLGYFLFRRRPPFPHAWVATRVPASRDLISVEKDGCILMQDRALPGTPKDAEKMRDYLRLDSDDTVVEHALGENMFLISFHRRDKA